jgi:hypothetical protein
MLWLRRAKVILVLGLALFCVGVWSIILGPYFYGADGSGLPSAAIQAVKQNSSLSRVSALLAMEQSALPPRTKTAGCTVAGPLPERACTPGEVFADATPAQICVAGYTKHVRSVSTALRKQLFAAYGVAYPPATGAYELDHLIPLALGGDNSAANLFPEAAAPKPGFKEKDVVEVYLQEEVCAGQIDIHAAQAQIAADWTAVYSVLDPSDIARIKQKYTSWAN